MLLDAFVASEVNQTWTATVLARTGLLLFSIYNEALQQATLAQLEASGFSLDALVACAREHEELFQQHVVALIALTAGAPIEQAYGPGDAGPGVWKPTQSLGVSRDFLVPHLIVFFYLIHQPNQLAAYLKKTRNPRPAALAKTYIEGFERLRRAPQ